MSEAREETTAAEPAPAAPPPADAPVTRDEQFHSLDPKVERLWRIQNLVGTGVLLFARRLGLATLVVDTAGQTNTGGGASIRNLPEREARRMQAELARSVARSKYGAVEKPRE